MDSHINKYLNEELTKLNISNCLIIIPKDKKVISNIENNLQLLSTDFNIINYDKKPDEHNLNIEIVNKNKIHKDSSNMTSINNFKNEKELKNVIQKYIQKLNEVIVSSKNHPEITKYINKSCSICIDDIEWANKNFLGSLCHQIKTPLNSILSGIQIINHYTDDDFVNRILDYMFQSSIELTNHVNDIVDFYHLSQNMIQLEPSDTDVLEIIKFVYKVFRQQLEEKQINFDFDIKNNCPQSINIDTKRLTQILVNLVSNCIKFIPETVLNKKIKIEISLCNTNINTNINTNTNTNTNNNNNTNTNTSTTKIYYLISVKDNGKGIDLNKVNELFNPFFQTKDKWMTFPDGLGLGLTICNLLLKKMGGYLKFEKPDNNFKTNACCYIPYNNIVKPIKSNNEINEDITFEYELDNNELDNIPKELEINNINEPIKQDIVKNVLIIEDNVTNMELLSIILENQCQEFEINGKIIQINYNIIKFTNSIEGEKYLHRNIESIDLLILDLKMPNRSGFEIINNLITFLNSINQNINLFPKTIIITALFNNLTIQHIDKIKKDNNLNDKLFNLFKPLNINLLQNLLKKILFKNNEIINENNNEQIQNNDSNSIQNNQYNINVIQNKNKNHKNKNKNKIGRTSLV